MSIRFHNRYTGMEETEKVYGESFIHAVYGTAAGRQLAKRLLTKPWISRAYGAFQNSALSRGKIKSFCRDYEINLQEFQPGPFRNFNDFFIRRFQPGARPFRRETDLLPAFAEARYLGFAAIDPKQLFPVKGKFLSVPALMDSYERCQPFLGGPCLIARLCPVDYHRFHFPDDGKILDRRFIHTGILHSVNPTALKEAPEIFCANEREVSILETAHFGKLAMIEVGALMVGKIVQSHPGVSFRRGEEKGYFLFGGSTVIVFGEKGAWKPSADILTHTQARREVFVRLGDEVGLK